MEYLTELAVDYKLLSKYSYKWRYSKEDYDSKIRGCGCADCKAPYNTWNDYLVSDKLWKIISPSPYEGGGLLCPTCIKDRVKFYQKLENNTLEVSVEYLTEFEEHLVLCMKRNYCKFFDRDVSIVDQMRVMVAKWAGLKVVHVTDSGIMSHIKRIACKVLSPERVIDCVVRGMQLSDTFDLDFKGLIQSLMGEIAVMSVKDFPLKSGQFPEADEDYIHLGTEYI